MLLEKELKMATYSVKFQHNSPKCAHSFPKPRTWLVWQDVLKERQTLIRGDDIDPFLQVECNNGGCH